VLSVSWCRRVVAREGDAEIDHLGRPGRGVIDAKRRGRAEAPESLAPESLDLLGILLLEPANVLAVGAHALEAGLFAGGVGLIEREDLFEEGWSRPAVEEDVVRAPDRSVLAIGEAEEGEAHERGAREIEAAAAVGVEELGEPRCLLGGRGAAEIVALDGEADLLADHLEGLLAALPDEGGAEDRVAIRHLLEGSDEGVDIDVAAQGEGALDHIDAAHRGIQRVEQHALLHRRQRIDVFDVLPAHLGSSVSRRARGRPREPARS
jgi:hypothetical protein